MDTKPKLTFQEITRNFWFNVISGGASKLSDQLASPGLVLPWIISAVGAPDFLVGVLVPIRRGLALLPQLATSSRIQAYSQKKPFWIGGAITQGVAITLMAAGVWQSSGLPAGLIIIGSLIIFSLARSVGSLTFKDVLAKSMPEQKRGQLLAGRAILGGITGLTASLILRALIGPTDQKHPYIILLLTASFFWFIAAALFSRIKEVPGQTAQKTNLTTQLIQGIKLLKKDTGFARYVKARLLYVSIGISLPFYTLVAKQTTGSTFSTLMILIILKGLAEISSSFVWGKASDQNARLVLVAVGGISLFSSLLALLPSQSTGNIQALTGILPLICIAAADQGSKIARDTYLVNATRNQTRPLYTAVTNTLSGGMALAAGSIAILIPIIGTQGLILILGMIAAIGSWLSYSLPDRPQFK